MAEKESPTRQQAGRITDARGRKVTQLDPLTMQLLRRHDSIEADVLRAIVSEKGVAISKWERVWLIVGVAALLAVASLFVYSVFVKKDFGAAPFARSASLMFFCFLPWLAWNVLKRSRFGKVTAAMLKHRRCPHCGYDLRLLPTDPEDGATVCPECGCAWRLDDRTPSGTTGPE
jgi:hypothetical protein